MSGADLKTYEAFEELEAARELLVEAVKEDRERLAELQEARKRLDVISMRYEQARSHFLKLAPPLSEFTK